MGFFSNNANKTGGSKSFKKTVIIVLVTMLVMTSALGATKEYPQRFFDVPREHYAFEYIAELAERGAINGYQDGSYKPNNTVSRAEWAKIMVVAANRTLGDSTSSFYDMSDGHWANPYINAAKQYMTSYEGGAAFRPDIAALREDVTVALVKLKGYDADNVDFSYIAKFKDQDSISASCMKYVAVAVEKGLISGYDDNTFRGQGTLTRAEAATLLWRAFQKGSDDKVVDTSGTDAGNDKVVDTTGKPSETPEIAVETADPKPSNSPEPTGSTPDKVRYTVDTIAKANVADKYKTGGIYDPTGDYHYTMDENDNLYYVDRGINKVVKVNVHTKFKEDVIDIAAIRYESDAVDYWDFKITNLYYDSYSGKLLATGGYTQRNGSGDLPRGTYELPGMNLISDKDVGNIIGTMRNGNYVACGKSTYYGTSYVLYMVDRDFHATVMAEASQGWGPVFSISQVGTDVYFPVAQNFYKYDFISLQKQFDFGYSASVAFNSQKVFVLDAGGLAVYNLFGKSLDSISKEEMKPIDLTAVDFNYVSYTLFVTANEDIVYYDRSAQAFRIISKSL